MSPERSWRAAAIEHFDELGYKGLLVVPEFRDHKRPAHIPDSPDGNVKIYAWEAEWLARADVILFWVPRDMKRLPGLTTNIEFGMFLGTKKIVFGAPPGAEHVEYMRYHCVRAGVSQAEKLSTTVHLSLVQLALVKSKTGHEFVARPHGY
jgi:hypothetical protein